MRKLIVATFASLDGVMQAPGGPQEDPSGGFTLGGWSFAYWDDSVDISAAGFDGAGRDLLLGRRTYEIFAAYWPYQAEDNPVARSLNAARKYVASRSLASLDWHNAQLLEGDVVEAVRALKNEDGPDLQVIGSGNLLQTLQRADLIDVHHVWTYPLVLGHGKRLFEHGSRPAAMRLEGSRVSNSGVVMSTYVPAGKVQPGSFAEDTPNETELARRRKLADEDR